MRTRFMKSSDYNEISPLINDWWGGREMSHMVPKVFFVHFQTTSFIVEQDNKTVGFLIGFVSQTNSEEAYIHFVGVHPEYRGNNIGRRLYEKFFSTVQKEGCKVVRCITSPINKTSIAYHTKMGFEVEEGDGVVDGVQVHRDYDGLNQDRVLFERKLL